MCKKRLTLILSAALLCGLALFLFLTRHYVLGGSAKPVTIFFVKNGAFNSANGYFANNGTTFWATNHTLRRQHIFWQSVEIPNGSTWTNYGSRVMIPLFFANGSCLNPHEAAYTTTKELVLPSVGPWRLSIAAFEELEGSAKIWARIKLSAKQLRRRFHTGSSIPVKQTLSNNKFFLGKPIHLASQQPSTPAEDHSAEPEDFNSKSVTELTQALLGPSPESRRKAAMALSRLGGEAAPSIGALIVTLSDTNKNVRVAAALAIGEIGPNASNAIPSLELMLNEKEETTERTVMRSIQQIQAQ